MDFEENKNISFYKLVLSLLYKLVVVHILKSKCYIRLGIRQGQNQSRVRIEFQMSIWERTNQIKNTYPKIIVLHLCETKII